ncbi:MAG: heavy metal sensor histidine kinase [Gammaproteobacteria bacterium]|nr:heavy metal sensor histidine kinase [Gammaproteobacteria bacterium]
MNPLRSVRTRLTLWYAASLATLLLVFSLSVYFYLRGGLQHALDEDLQQRYTIVENGLNSSLDQLSEVEDHGAVNLFLVTEGENVVHQTRSWLLEGLDASMTPASGPRWSWSAPQGQMFHLLQGEVISAERKFHLVVAQERTLVEAGLARLRWALFSGFPIALAVAVSGGGWLARRALAPVGDMAARARAITAERLSERLPVRDPHDEFGQLAVVFNATFERLQQSFEQLRRFTADASHELRTPLTVLRSVGEAGLQKNRDAAGYREVIGSMLEETERLTRLVESLLTLSRYESGRAPLKFEAADIGVLVCDVAECLRVLAEEKEQTLRVDCEPSVFATADRILLRQALMNLVDNAIKYTPAKGQIRVTVRHAQHQVCIEVIDTGPGIPAEHHARIFERFYRVDAGRARDRGGVGLGLAIARWIIEQHQGVVDVVSVAGQGAKFRIALPSRSTGVPERD